MSWRALSPDIGLIPGDYDSSAHVLQVEMPVPAGDYNPERLALFSRNTLAMMDCALSQQSVNDGIICAELESKGPIAEQFLEDIAGNKLKRVNDQLSIDGKRILEMGQVGDLSRFRLTSEDELRFAEANKDIIIGAEHEFYEGGFRVRLSDALTIMRETRLGREDEETARRTMLIHGRSGTQHFTRTRTFDPEKDRLGPRFKGKANFSLGSYAGIIQPHTFIKGTDDSFREQPWTTIKGSGLVEKFALGLLDRHNKHLILHADGQIPNIRPSDIWVNVNVYRVDENINSQTSVYRNWYTLPSKKKERLHTHGADLVEVMNLNDDTVQKQIFDFSRLNNEREYHAMVISPHGVTPVGVLPEEREFFDDKLLESVRLEDRYRGMPAEYQDFKDIVENLKKATPEGARILVLDTLPEAEMLSSLYHEGVRGVIFKEMSPGNTSMASADTNKTMKNLTNAGMQFMQHDLSDIWIYQGEQMVRHSYSEAYQEATIRITNYGTANESRMDHEPAMRDFLKFVIEFFGDDLRSKIVLEDGGGPASMRCSSAVAIENGALNSGIAIFAEVVDGQSSRKKEYGAFWMYPVDDIATRQRSMDLARSIAIIHPGGLGTFFETVTSGLSIQMLEKSPFPVFVIDEQNKLNGFRELLKDMCVPDADGNCLAAPWIEKIFVFCESYEEAKVKFTELMSDLKPLWYEMLEAGMKIEDFKYAVNRESMNLRSRGLNGPDEFFNAQVRDFLAELETAGLS